ncbi:MULTISPECIES: phytanoyl-CoA dioxygenase family protein [unclassified Caballeronia]|uniref:phytanoyl-CoA dioxygenase family protein n=1 Tax=unclassified Caballeronia TaxID=2646786 RepID=UPI00285EEB66|nr:MULTISPECIES: phytanoyl-CoA dioxygenase family protein [unclassified Caballeronia]MDR5739605.1 phytanoyl-CoA dioxygenase family protein [Caballeronia sp. LZ016]MDR5808072.1 phytanoyl-CoA dioxygenase family protein [Caballeronia sp. LZ019]
MQRVDAESFTPELAVDALLNGPGAICIRGLFSATQIGEARRIVMAHSDDRAHTVTHFQGQAAQEDKLHLQRRVWNLLAKGDVFSQMAEQDSIVAAMRRFLGDDFVMGSIAANRILPGGPGQEPHIDYPYWDYHMPATFPAGINTSFPLNAQVTIPLDPFTAETGATAFVPHTQHTLRYPNESDRFFERAARMEAEPGDAIVFFGATWHCAMPNHSPRDRSAVLIQYLPKFVKPMEDLRAMVGEAFVRRASKTMRQLLGLNYPYPQNLEAVDQATNAEGRTNAKRY